MMFRLYLGPLLCAMLAGCATLPQSSPALRQQAQADLVVNFQSWNSIAFLKPDITGTAGTLRVRTKTFTRAAVVKLLRNLKDAAGICGCGSGQTIQPRSDGRQGRHGRDPEVLRRVGFSPNRHPGRHGPGRHRRPGSLERYNRKTRPCFAGHRTGSGRVKRAALPAGRRNFRKPNHREAGTLALTALSMARTL